MSLKSLLLLDGHYDLNLIKYEGDVLSNCFQVPLQLPPLHWTRRSLAFVCSIDNKSDLPLRWDGVHVTGPFTSPWTYTSGAQVWRDAP